MIYERVNWLNKGETGAKPINKTNLNQMDKGIYDLQNIELNINYKSGTDAPYVTCWGISCGTYPSDHVDRIPASKIIEYLNTYCD